jgi:hypothetical protein
MSRKVTPQLFIEWDHPKRRRWSDLEASRTLLWENKRSKALFEVEGIHLSSLYLFSPPSLNFNFETKKHRECEALVIGKKNNISH